MDYIKNIEPMHMDLNNTERVRTLKELGAQMVSQSVWETISESQPPKQIVNRRIFDAALLRPGRFDCIIPVGGLDDQGRQTIFNHYLSATNRGDVDVDKIISIIALFTPADIEYLFQKVKQLAFEREYIKGEDYPATTETFLGIIPEVSSTLTDEIIKEFEQDCAQYARY